MYKRSKALARYLRHSLGLEVGDTVAIVLPNIPEFAIALLGSAEAGLRVTTVNPIYTHGKVDNDNNEISANIHRKVETSVSEKQKLILLYI